jgi:hypothetical protein
VELGASAFPTEPSCGATDTKTDANGVETGSQLLVVVRICWLDFRTLAAQPPQNCGNERRFCCSMVSGGLSVALYLFDSDLRLD